MIKQKKIIILCPEEIPFNMLLYVLPFCVCANIGMQGLKTETETILFCSFLFLLSIFSYQNSSLIILLVVFALRLYEYTTIWSNKSTLLRLQYVSSSFCSLFLQLLLPLLLPLFLYITVQHWATWEMKRFVTLQRILQNML